MKNERMNQMNVLQAIDKLDELDDEVTALDIAIQRIEHDKSFANQVEILHKLKDEKVKERKQLRGQLEKTPLVSLR
jgi:hypothetical protein